MEGVDLRPNLIGRSVASAGSRWRVQTLRHIDPAEPALLGPVGFHEAHAPIERDVLGHGLVRVEPDRSQAPFPGPPLGEADQRAAMAASLRVGTYGDIIEEHRTLLRNQNDDSGNAALVEQDVDMSLPDQGR